jgi:large subunit ribosomal protein L24
LAKKQINTKPIGIRTGDQVIVIAGSGKSKTPRTVLSVLPKERKVIIEGVNLVKDRQKPGASQRASGINQQEVIEKPFPINASNVQLYDAQAKKATRVRTTVNNGKRQRTSIKSGQAI